MREEKINKIISNIRKDLRVETKSFLELISDDELNEVYSYIDSESGVYCLEIEYQMLKYLVQNKINSEDYRGWDLLNSPFYDASVEKYGK